MYIRRVYHIRRMTTRTSTLKERLPSGCGERGGVMAGVVGVLCGDGGGIRRLARGLF